MDFNILDYHISMDRQRILLYYKGPFDEMILSKISFHLREKFEDHPKAGKKMFAIFIELAQNISYYSAETNHFGKESEASQYGVGTIVIHETDEVYTLTVGNLVRKDVIEQIIDKIHDINELTQDRLREMKRDLRRAPREEGQRGGNIGLVQVALKADQPLKVESREVNDDFSFFVLSTDILK